MSTRGRWRDSAEEKRIRCRATERRGTMLVQCSEDRRTEHAHQWRGRAFADQSTPANPTPTLGPAPVKRT